MLSQKIQSILYVDDDPDICTVVQATLCMMAGLDVHTAGSGERAIDLAYELRPDLVLMDVMMPGLDGPSTLKRMRGHALLAHIPVIFLTAKVLPAEIARLRHLGALGVIGKPFDPLKLCDEVFALWKNTVAEQEVAGTEAGASLVRAKVDSLTDSFLKRTRGDIDRLRAFIERARQEDKSAYEDGQRLAHSIHGAGAMFGFPEISRTAGGMELVFENAMSSAVTSYAGSDPAVLQQLRALADRLAQDVHAAAREASGGGGMFATGSMTDNTPESDRLA